MRIAVDGSCWANRRGFGRYTRCLVGEMVQRDAANDYVIVLDSASAADPSLPALPEGAELSVVRVGAAPAQDAAAAGSRRLIDVARMTAGLRRARADVAFFPASYSYFPVVGPPVVVTVHDAIAERLPHLTLAGRADRVRWRIKQRLALRQSRAVITVSEASARAIRETLGVPGDRVHVIGEAAAPVFRALPADEIRARLAPFGVEPGSYFLYVGGISPHKNLTALVDAFGAVGVGAGQPRLLLTGDLDGDVFLSAVPTVRAAVDRSPASDRITFTGYVPDDDLAALYGGAIASVLPSLGEGFGLTAAESAACGTPVIASRDPALVELLGEAGVYADAEDRSALTTQLARLATDGDYRDERAAAVARQAAGWSWARAADATVAVLEQAARG